MFKNFMKGEKEAWVNKMADTHHPAGKKKNNCAQDTCFPKCSLTPRR